MHRIWILALALLALPLAAHTAGTNLRAQTARAQPAADWYLADPASGMPGISLAAAYQLLASRTPSEIVVAIIDSGVDGAHPDLAPVMWTNADEIAGNGVDDDGNGYADDVHGWSFLGGADGQNVEHETYEITRIVRDRRQRFETVSPRPTPSATPSCRRSKRSSRPSGRSTATTTPSRAACSARAEEADALLRERFGDAYDADDPGALDVGMDMEARAAQNRLVQMQAQGLGVDDLRAMMAEVRIRAGLRLQPRLRPARRSSATTRPTSTERLYGNADVHGPDPNHGTGVAGLVAARPRQRLRHRRHRAACGSWPSAPCPTATSATRTSPTPSATPSTTARASST